MKLLMYRRCYHHSPPKDVRVSALPSRCKSSKGNPSAAVRSLTALCQAAIRPLAVGDRDQQHWSQCSGRLTCLVFSAIPAKANQRGLP